MWKVAKAQDNIFKFCCIVHCDLSCYMVDTFVTAIYVLESCFSMPWKFLRISCPLGSWVSLWNFETISGSLMKPNWQKLASLAHEICTLWFQFFGAVFASKGYPFKNIFVHCLIICDRIWNNWQKNYYFVNQCFFGNN